MTDTQSLNARLEAATGPDRGIDLALHEMRTGKKYRWAEFGGAFGVIDPQTAQIAVEVLPFDGTEREHLFHWAERDVGLVPAYTASIDAALTLVGDQEWPNDPFTLLCAAMLLCKSGKVADLPRFIVIAALRAIEARQQ